MSFPPVVRRELESRRDPVRCAVTDRRGITARFSIDLPVVEDDCGCRRADSENKACNKACHYRVSKSLTR